MYRALYLNYVQFKQISSAVKRLQKNILRWSHFTSGSEIFTSNKQDCPAEARLICHMKYSSWRMQKKKKNDFRHPHIRDKSNKMTAKCRVHTRTSGAVKLLVQHAKVGAAQAGAEIVEVRGRVFRGKSLPRSLALAGLDERRSGLLRSVGRFPRAFRDTFRSTWPGGMPFLLLRKLIGGAGGRWIAFERCSLTVFYARFRSSRNDVLVRSSAMLTPRSLWRLQK